jgi:hypothetical protein
MNINESQTPEFRRFKYAQARAAGATRERARRIRDFETMACIAEIAHIRGIEKQQAGMDFFHDLEESKIKPYRTSPIMHHIQNKQDIPTI